MAETAPSNLNSYSSTPNITHLHPDGCSEQLLSAHLSDVSDCALVLSYAPPEMLLQAKHEALVLRVRRKMLESRTSMNDRYALGEWRGNGRDPSPTLRVSARSGAPFSMELVHSLVVPPAVTAHGEEVSGSSAFILDGERLQYQRPADATHINGSQSAASQLSYRTCDPVKRMTAAERRRKKAAEAAEAAAGLGPAAAVAGVEVSRVDLAAQLSEGMLRIPSYVPTKVQRPMGVKSTAFMPMGPALKEARNKIANRSGRPGSAPAQPKRSLSMARSVDADGDPQDGDPVEDGKGAAEGAQGSRGWLGPRVQETDLLALYRQNSQIALAAAAAEATLAASARKPMTSAPFNGNMAAATITTATSASPLLSPKTPSTPEPLASTKASNRHLAAAGAAAHGARSTPASRPQPQQTQPRPENGSSAATATPPLPQTPQQSSGNRTSPPTSPRTPTPAPALVNHQRPRSAAVATATTPSPAKTTSTRAWSARPAPSSPAVTTPRSTPLSPRPPSPRSPTPASTNARRPPQQRPGTSSSPSAATASILDSAPDSNTSNMTTNPRNAGFTPMGLDKRRLRQQSSAGAIVTPKTSRLRVMTPRGPGGPLVAEGSGSMGAPAWASPGTSSFSSVLEGRSQLQERILGGLVRQYTLSPGEEPGSGGGVGGGGGLVAHRRPSARLPAAAAVAAAAAVEGSVSNGTGGGAQSAEALQPPRPQSAPNRRLRPPAPGSWAGRPDPEVLHARAAAAQASGTGMVYDPEVQPGPLESYMSQLVGLD